MFSLSLLYLTVGMAVSAPITQESIDNQMDSIYLSTDDSTRQHSETRVESVVISKRESDDNSDYRADDVLKPLPKLASTSKKYLTVVKNSNENNLPDLVDTNPLLTEIMSYDPMLYRVWPRGPSWIPDDYLMDYVKPDPLTLPLVFALHQPDYSLRRKDFRQSPYILSTSTTDSLMDTWKYGYESIRQRNQFLQELESRMIRYVQYDRDQLPDVDPMVFIIEESKPMILEKPSLSIKNNTNRQQGNYPSVSYNPWTAKGNFKLHFSQTYLSSNWSKGGESNMAGLTTLYLEANYNDLKNVQFDNSLELKIGMNTVSSDTLRNLNVSTDQLRAVSKLGVRMRSNWYYSLSSEFTTQVLNNYRKNTMNLQSSFMSPAKLFVSLGVDFKKTDKKKGYNLSVMLSPITYKANYLYDNVNLNPKSYGIDPGKHFSSEIGSKVSSNISWKLSEWLNWKSRIYYFSDYTYVDTEWENTFDITLNSYFSTQVYVYAKMNDRLKRDPGESLIQLQQLLSFGMTYHF